MHSASSRTSYSREPASKQTAAKALSATRPVFVLGLWGNRRNAVDSHPSGSDWRSGSCQMESLVAQGYSLNRCLSVHNGSPVRAIVLMAVREEYH